MDDIVNILTGAVRVRLYESFDNVFLVVRDDKGFKGTFVPLDFFQTCNVKFHPHLVAKGETQRDRAGNEILLLCKIFRVYLVLVIYDFDLIAFVLLWNLNDVDLIVRIFDQLLPHLGNILLPDLELIELILVSIILRILPILFSL